MSTAVFELIQKISLFTQETKNDRERAKANYGDGGGLQYVTGRQPIDNP